MNTSNVKFIANQLYTWWAPRIFKHGVELADGCENWLFEANFIRDNNESAVNRTPDKGHVFRTNIFTAPRASWDTR
jgi:hypothetical protein